MKLFRHFAFVVCLALGATQLTACALSPPVQAALAAPAPNTIADKTTLDERAALSVELAYQAGATLLIAAVDAGWLDDATQAKAFAAERTAWRAVQLTRSAYDAGNAASYANALDAARTSIATLIGFTRKGDAS